MKCLQIKNQIFQEFKNFVVFIQTQFEITIQRIWSDNEGEYADSWFQDEMTKKDMKWELTIIYNSHENSIAECINQILLNKMICMLADSDFPQNLWSELLDTAAYLWNQSSIKHLKKHRKAA